MRFIILALFLALTVSCNNIANPFSKLVDILSSVRQETIDNPFSFNLGGVSSDDVLNGWSLTNTTEKTQTTTKTSFIYESAAGLQFYVNVTTFINYPSAVDWVVGFRNTGSVKSDVISFPKTAVFAYDTSTAEDVTLYYQDGSHASPDDYTLHNRSIHVQETEDIHNEYGRPSESVLPFMSVEWPSTAFKGFEGLTIGIGWASRWRAKFARDNYQLQISVDIASDMQFVLLPGEHVRFPRVLVVSWEGEDFQTGQNIFRQLMLNEYLRKVDGKVAHPPLSSMAYWDGNIFYPQVNTSTGLDFVALAQDRNQEALWIDCSWFIGKFPNGAGNWAIPLSEAVWKGLQPDGLHQIAEKCHNPPQGESPIKFILWVEPERIHNGTWLWKNKPNYLLKCGQAEDALFNLADPEARAYIKTFLIDMIDSFGLDILRIDYNIDPLCYWQAQDDLNPLRRGITQLKGVMGLYDLWDSIIAERPHVIIDNCASGGRRIELETMRRSITDWRTDFISEDGNYGRFQGLHMGLAHFHPAAAGWTGKHTINGIDFLYGADPYLWRSTVTTGAVLPWDQHLDTPAQRVIVQAAQAETRRLRPLMLSGNFWRLTSDTRARDVFGAYQYHSTEKSFGAVYYFRRLMCKETSFSAKLREIDVSATYSVLYYYDYDISKKVLMPGVELQNLNVTISTSPGSLLLEYYSTE